MLLCVKTEILRENTYVNDITVCIAVSGLESTSENSDTASANGTVSYPQPTSGYAGVAQLSATKRRGSGSQRLFR
jgi:hypothetical protein